ncbi:hypothetical protein [Arthrobacter antibioticus]|uniref:hypothetical protein n=1 Tax=Arthrobacter sp. H35-MC1 TaxID=3046203 RepID=UPI0024BBBC2F|nr:hypothetical protein [Arthrobacter sp. H35-MC1]MDJ0317635.1 hypothetical protein [Arthrobacter sp. H35-MC1]
MHFLLPMSLAHLLVTQETKNAVIAFLDTSVHFISGALPTVIAVVTLLIAWMTFKVSRESKLVAEQSRIVAEQSHRTSQESLQVAINDWKQVGREEPWSLTKLDKNYWLLERLHYNPAAIVAAEASPHCGGSAVNFQNPAGAPVSISRRGAKVVLEIPSTNPGASLTLYYREFAESEAVPTRNQLYFAGNAWSDEGVAARDGSNDWTTALY